MRLLSLIVCASALSLLGCEEPPDPPPEFASGNLAGVVGGEDWEFAGGATDDFLSDEEEFFTSFFGVEAEDACDPFGPSSDILTGLNIPSEQSCDVDEDCNNFRSCNSGSCGGPAIFNLSLRNSLTFVVDDGNGGIDNLIATSGAMRIDEIDEENATITGAIDARFDADNDIDGEFEVTICPE